MMILPSDWAPNMSALTNIPAIKDSFRQKDPVRPFEVVPDVHTVCFVISDGDNVQWLLGSHDSPTSWNNPNRARVNLGWTISPALAELAPWSMKNMWITALPHPKAGMYLSPGLPEEDTTCREDIRMPILKRKANC